MNGGVDVGARKQMSDAVCVMFTSTIVIHLADKSRWKVGSWTHAHRQSESNFFFLICQKEGGRERERGGRNKTVNGLQSWFAFNGFNDLTRATSCRRWRITSVCGLCCCYLSISFFSLPLSFSVSCSVSACVYFCVCFRVFLSFVEAPSTHAPFRNR